MMLERFYKKIEDRDGCWYWTAAKDREGYGRFWDGERVTYAHRVSYRLFVGPIPVDEEIDHLCRNKSCVNPEHLRACDHRTNILAEGCTAPPAIHARKTHCPRGHEYSEGNTYRSKKGARRCRECKQAAERRRYHEKKIANA